MGDAVRLPALLPSYPHPGALKCRESIVLLLPFPFICAAVFSIRCHHVPELLLTVGVGDLLAACFGVNYLVMQVSQPDKRTKERN